MKTKEQIKQLGVWMDHASAKLVMQDGKVEEVFSNLSKHQKIPGESGDGIKLGNYRTTNNEVHKLNKETNELHAYFNDLHKAITPFDEVLLFGPSTAHDEFANYVIEKHKHFPGKITLAKTDYLTENQLTAYVKGYFKNEQTNKSV